MISQFNMRGCVTGNDFWPWPISSRSLSCDFAMRWLKYGTSCCVSTTARTVLDEFFPYLAQMITSMKGCVASNDLWPWPISSRLFYGLHVLYSYVAKIQPIRDDVLCTISRSIGIIDVQLPSPMTSQFNGCFHFFVFFFSKYVFLKLIVACRLCVIYVREDNDSNV